LEGAGRRDPVWKDQDKGSLGFLFGFFEVPEEEDAESQIKDGAAVGSQGSQTLCPILLAS